MLKNNKKGVSEVISYLLLTLLVALISSGAFFFAQGYLENIRADSDAQAMETHLKQLTFLLSENMRFDREAAAYRVSFDTGQLEFNGTQITYVTLNSYDGDELCLSVICYDSRNGTEIYRTTLPNDFSFEQKSVLVPGDYYIYFETRKNEKEIAVSLR